MMVLLLVHCSVDSLQRQAHSSSSPAEAFCQQSIWPWLRLHWLRSLQWSFAPWPSAFFFFLFFLLIISWCDFEPQTSLRATCFCGWGAWSGQTFGFALIWTPTLVTWAAQLLAWCWLPSERREIRSQQQGNVVNWCQIVIMNQYFFMYFSVCSGCWVLHTQSCLKIVHAADAARWFWPTLLYWSSHSLECAWVMFKSTGTAKAWPKNS